jgi:hypothetical protein
MSIAPPGNASSSLDDCIALKTMPDETAMQQLVRESPRVTVQYDTWFKAKVQAAQADPRPAIDAEEWDTIRAKKLTQRNAITPASPLICGSELTTKSAS